MMIDALNLGRKKGARSTTAPKDDKGKLDDRAVLIDELIHYPRTTPLAF